MCRARAAVPPSPDIRVLPASPVSCGRAVIFPFSKSKGNEQRILYFTALGQPSMCPIAERRCQEVCRFTFRDATYDARRGASRWPLTSFAPVYPAVRRDAGRAALVAARMRCTRR